MRHHSLLGRSGKLATFATITAGIVFVILAMCSGPLYAQALSRDTRARVGSFQRIKSTVLTSERENVVDQRLYKAPEGSLVLSSTEMCGSRECAKAALEAEVKKWSSCEAYEDVIDGEQLSVGRRTICSMNPPSRRRAVIYSFGQILRVISGYDLESLKLFEKEACPRSTQVAGRKCKY